MRLGFQRLRCWVPLFIESMLLAMLLVMLSMGQVSAEVSAGAQIERVGMESLKTARIAGAISTTLYRDAHGTQWLSIQRPKGGYSAFIIGFQTGAAQDPAERPGLAYFTAEMLLRGSAGRSREALEDGLAVLGGRLGVSVEPSFTVFEGEVLTAHLEEALLLIDGVLRAPNFGEYALDQLKKEVEAQRASEQENDELLARRTFRQFLHEGHPLSNPLLGTSSTMARIQVDDLLAFHRLHYVRPALIGISSEREAEDLLKMLAAEGSAPRLVLSPKVEVTIPVLESTPVERSGRRVLLLNKARRTQNQIFIGQQLPPPTHPDHLALEVLSVLLGDSSSSRLSRVLRKEKGWVYGITSDLWRNRSLSALGVWTFAPPDRGVDVIETILQEMERLSADGVQERELHSAQRLLQQRWAAEMASPQRQLGTLGRALMGGVSLETLEQRPKLLAALNVTGVNTALRLHIKPLEMTILMLCTARHFQRRVLKIDDVSSVMVMAPGDER